jgi:hypothetical protein
MIFFKQELCHKGKRWKKGDDGIKFVKHFWVRTAFYLVVMALKKMKISFLHLDLELLHFLLSFLANSNKM